MAKILKKELIITYAYSGPVSFEPVSMESDWVHGPTLCTPTIHALSDGEHSTPLSSRELLVAVDIYDLCQVQTEPQRSKHVKENLEMMFYCLIIRH